MEKYEKSFRKLIAWQKARDLRLEIYKITMLFPKEERYGLIDQLRRAASSIAAQLAEGSQMPTSALRKLYYDRAYASAAEVDDFLELSCDLHYINSDQYKHLLESLNKTSMFIRNLSASERLTQPTKHTQPNPRP